MYIERSYRRGLSGDLAMRRLAVRQTDLAVCLLPAAWNDDLQAKTLQFIEGLRVGLEEYIKVNPEFAATHQPYFVEPPAPCLAFAMAKAGNLAGIGPMSAVAGAFAEAVGHFLLPYSSEVMVENGGDIFLAGTKDRLVGVFAGKSSFSGRLALKIKASQMPLGICTSSGTVGPSFSYGRADAAIILSPDTLLADAVATATGNLVQTADDVKKAVDFAASIEGITGAVVIKDKAMAAWGDVELIPVNK
ncbi:MAG: UPF0280 family protein [Clostridiales bacterium]